MTWFEADGFRLRAAEPSDTDALFGYLNDGEVFADRQFDLEAPWPLGRIQIERHLSETSDTSLRLVIETGGGIVGHAAVDWWWDALQPWAGVAVAPQHRRHGYGRRAATMVLSYLFDHTPAHVVVAEVADWNDAGLQFAAAMGFANAGKFRHAAFHRGRWRDTVTFDLLRREWKGRHAAGR